MLERLGLVRRAPDVGVGRVGLLDAVAVGQVVLDEPLAHLGAAAELADEVGVEPRLVDAQRRVGEQAVAVEPLDVVALERRAVAPDVHVVGLHRPHQHRAGDGPAERGGVEVGAAGRADVERPAGQRGQALLDQLAAAVDRAGQLGAVLQRARRDLGRCRARRTGRCRRCRCTAPRPCRASRPPRPRCRGRRRRRCRRARRRGWRSGPCSRALRLLVGCRDWGRATAARRSRRARWPPRGSRAMTRMVSSPATVPSTSGRPARSSALARKFAAPGGVRRTTRLALASAETSSSPSSRASRCGGASSTAARGQRRAVLGHDVDRQPAVGSAQLDRAELLEVARQRGLGDVRARHRAAPRRARPASGPARRRDRRRCGRAGRPCCWLVHGRAAVALAGRHQLLLQQPGQQRLLRVQAVLGLVPHDALRPVDDVGADLLAPVGGQAVQHDRVGVGARGQRGVDGVGPNGAARSACSPPGPSRPRCRWRARRRRRRPPSPVGARVTEPPVSAAIRCASATIGRVGLVAGRAGDPDVHAGQRAAEQVGVGHVVGGVAEVGQRQPGQPALVLADGLQVGQHLARVELVGQRVDHRHARWPRPSPRCVPGRTCARRSPRPAGRARARCRRSIRRGRAGCSGRR